MEPLTLLIIIGGVILGNELIISLSRSYRLHNHKMAYRKHKHKTQENYETFASDKKRT
ncbi:hypothetical protein [Acidianus bottle-shaped virus]|uniref:Uncharacterized protein ORF57 n=1 Tax=Acidianus bottle-shaped virus (isolate Italy/Pozzuoli) TaxID=654911 RepID=Y057_ABVP|nr:hypothetical protein ABV_gp49 [Acidianus bottle-shaped virus]A4ZUD5.1 RecName: Full=Uncharacterized protein ORF57 [Acidianus bottle-shaped virus (isolate Pozzuoli)]ABP73439.1 hypothetical protein [Acidianus bottle-shaped virus]